MYSEGDSSFCKRAVFAICANLARMARNRPSSTRSTTDGRTENYDRSPELGWGLIVLSYQGRVAGCVGPEHAVDFGLRAEVDESREDRSKLTVLR